MAPLHYLLRSTGITLFRRDDTNFNATALFDPSVFTAPVLDAIKAKGNENRDALTLIGFVLTIVFVTPQVCSLCRWLWLNGSQLRRQRPCPEMLSPKVPLPDMRRPQPSQLPPQYRGSALVKLYFLIDQPPEWFKQLSPESTSHTRTWRQALRRSAYAWAREVFFRIYYRSPGDAFWDSFLESGKIDAQAAWQRMLAEEPELARHKNMVIRNGWPEIYASHLKNSPNWKSRQNYAGLRQRRQVKPELRLARPEESEAKGVYQTCLEWAETQSSLVNQPDTDAQLPSVRTAAQAMTSRHDLDAFSHDMPPTLELSPLHLAKRRKEIWPTKEGAGWTHASNLTDTSDDKTKPYYSPGLNKPQENPGRTKEEPRKNRWFKPYNMLARREPCGRTHP